MKKIIIAIILMLAVKAYSQDFADTFIMSDTLIAGTDSLVIDTLYGNYENVYVSVSDTQATAKDSVAFESWDEKLQTWIRVGAVNTFDNSNVMSGVAITGLPRKFLLNDKAIYILRQRLLQGSYRAGARVLTSVSGINR